MANLWTSGHVVRPVCERCLGGMVSECVVVFLGSFPLPCSVQVAGLPCPEPSMCAIPVFGLP